MTEAKASLEVIAPTVEEAVQRGLGELGLTRDEVEVEVLDEGSRGLFGLGARQARVRLTVRTTAATAAAPEPTPAPPAAAVVEEDETLRVARETVEELLQRMDLRARVEARWGTADGPDKPTPLLVDVRGDDLSILIGRRGETLNALQFITRLIVGKELRRPVPILIDVEGYRARREQQLRRLARRVAEQAMESGRPVALEPMPAYERRIIHLELRDHPHVYTESVGEGERRKVTIFPRR